MNQVNLIGRLTNKPEAKETQSGVKVCSFTMAVDRQYKDDQGNKPTDFINCVVWRQGANYLASYADKGDLIAVSGEINIRKYQTQEGKNASVTEINVKEIKILSTKQKDAPSPFENIPYNKETEENIDYDPFYGE